MNNNSNNHRFGFGHNPSGTSSGLRKRKHRPAEDEDDHEWSDDSSDMRVDDNFGRSSEGFGRTYRKGAVGGGRKGGGGSSRYRAYNRDGAPTASHSHSHSPSSFPYPHSHSPFASTSSTSTAGYPASSVTAYDPLSSSQSFSTSNNTTTASPYATSSSITTSTSSTSYPADPLRHLYFRAYEADLIRSADDDDDNDRHNSDSIARSLEVDHAGDGRPLAGTKTALVRWGGGTGGVGSVSAVRGWGTKYGLSDDTAPDSSGPVRLGRGLGHTGAYDDALGSRASAGLHVRDDDEEDEHGYGYGYEDGGVGQGFGGALSAANPQQDARQEIWVDRYDIRLLLDTLPESARGANLVEHDTEGEGHFAGRPESPGSAGWSDLESDTEDVFFFSPSETEEYRHEMRKRAFAEAREARMKALEEEEKRALGQSAEDQWGGSDEEPDEDEKQLMRRTAAHIASADNAAQLEMRILANFGADKRFAFLRGRWSRAWRLMLAHARQEKLAKEKPVQPKASLGGLAGYGSDSEDSDNENENDDGDSGKRDVESKPPTTSNEVVVDATGGGDSAAGGGGGGGGGGNGTTSTVLDASATADADEEERKKEARRQRAKAWAESRKTLSSTQPT